MPRTFPSQTVGYLTALFQKRHTPDFGNVRDNIGAVAGFLELYDQLPSELVRLAPDDYASLVAAVGKIRFAIDHYGVPDIRTSLMSVPAALEQSWKIIEKLHDEVPSISHELSFIADEGLREIIGLDLSAITTGLQSGEWKGTTILAGSFCEALLLYALQTAESKSSGKIAAATGAMVRPGKPPNSSDLTDRSWDLSSYASVATHLKLISANIKSVPDPARDYRNLIHPAKAIRESASFNRGTAFVGVGAVEHLITDLRNNL
jgi:hypothetical protein